MDDADVAAEKEETQKDLYLTGTKGQKIEIQVLGGDMAYDSRKHVANAREITLQYLKISDLGKPGSIRELIPKCMTLHLDKNFLYSWD